VATLNDYKLKVPISKQLIVNLIFPCIAITGVGLYDLYSKGQKRFDQNIVFIILFFWGARIISIVETLLGVLAFIFFLISLISSFIGLASFENNPKLKGRGYGYASLVILGLIVLLFLLSF
jgi:hypothetical protein